MTNYESHSEPFISWSTCKTRILHVENASPKYLNSIRVAGVLPAICRVLEEAQPAELKNNDSPKCAIERFRLSEIEPGEGAFCRRRTLPRQTKCGVVLSGKNSATRFRPG